MSIRVCPGCRPSRPRLARLRSRRGASDRYLKVAFERYYLEKMKRDLPSLHFGW